jgi:hypothetical protein
MKPKKRTNATPTHTLRHALLSRSKKLVTNDKKEPPNAIVTHMKIKGEPEKNNF